MDILSATVAIVSLLVPVAAAFGVNRLHLGVKGSCSSPTGPP
jgi:TRAP-type C4-dicarboxylate transport system permease large subunit